MSKDLEQEIEKLKKQLAEKEKEAETYKREIVFLDKKIKELKEEIKDIKKFYSKELKNKIEVKCFGATENFKKQLRHEICDKIKNMAHDYFEFPICENCGETLFASSDVIMTGSDFEKILQEVEKGEE